MTGWARENEAAVAFASLHTPIGECHCANCETNLDGLERYLGLVESLNGVNADTYDRSAEIRRVGVERGWPTQTPHLPIRFGPAPRVTSQGAA